MKREITNIWKNLQELDLRPLLQAAEKEIRITLVGVPGVGRHTLTAQMRNDPARPTVSTDTPVTITDLDNLDSSLRSDLIVLMIDVNTENVSKERALLNNLQENGQKVLVFYNKLDQLPRADAVIPWVEAESTRVLYGSALDRTFLLEELVPAVTSLLPNQHLSLGRHFPLFREHIAGNLITDTCIANAVYSLGTGLAEIVPVLDLPLNVADMVVLTKAQALLVYKLGLTLGLSTDWQYYVGEFSSVIGGGFVWRQIARQLVGLIPIWGLVPKVAVAYSGTYVVGQVVLHWYLTGRHLSRKRMREISNQAFQQGKELARGMLDKIPRPSFGRRKKNALPETKDTLLCVHCATINNKDANFCNNCGQALPVVNA